MAATEIVEGDADSQTTQGVDAAADALDALIVEHRLAHLYHQPSRGYREFVEQLVDLVGEIRPLELGGADIDGDAAGGDAGFVEATHRLERLPANDLPESHDQAGFLG